MNEKSEDERKIIEADALVELAKTFDKFAEIITTYETALMLYSSTNEINSQKILKVEKLKKQVHANIAYVNSYTISELISTKKPNEPDLDYILDLVSSLDSEIQASGGFAEEKIGFDELTKTYQSLEEYLKGTVLPNLNQFPFKISSIRQKVDNAISYCEEKKNDYKFRLILEGMLNKDKD